MARFRAQSLAVADAAAELGLSRSRFYVLFADYLAACAQRRQRQWLPGISGGDQRKEWPQDVVALLRKLLGSSPPASYPGSITPSEKNTAESVFKARFARGLALFWLAAPA